MQRQLWCSTPAIKQWCKTCLDLRQVQGVKRRKWVDTQPKGRSEVLPDYCQHLVVRIINWRNEIDREPLAARLGLCWQVQPWILELWLYFVLDVASLRGAQCETIDDLSWLVNPERNSSEIVYREGLKKCWEEETEKNNKSGMDWQNRGTWITLTPRMQH